MLVIQTDEVDQLAPSGGFPILVDRFEQALEKFVVNLIERDTRVGHSLYHFEIILEASARIQFGSVGHLKLSRGLGRWLPSGLKDLLRRWARVNVVVHVACSGTTQANETIAPSTKRAFDPHSVHSVYMPATSLLARWGIQILLLWNKPNGGGAFSRPQFPSFCTGIDIDGGNIFASDSAHRTNLRAGV